MAKPLLHVDFQQPKDLVFNRAKMRRAFIQIGQVHMRDARRLVMRRGRSAPGEYPGFRTGRLARSIGYYVPRASKSRPGLMVRIAPNQKRGEGNRLIDGDFYVRWDGVTGSASIDTGVTIQRDDLVSFTTTASATPSGGVLRVPVTCDTTGVIGNTDDGITMRLTSPVTGLPSAGIADTIQGGTDIEDLEVWRARIIERWYYTPQGGADADYEVWAKEVAGVTRAWTYRHWSGRGTVGVMLANSNLYDPIPDAAVVATVQAHIEPLAPIAGADVYAFAATPHVVNYHIRLTPDTQEIRLAVEAEIRAMNLRDGVPEGALEPSRISEAISLATGEYSHVLVSPTNEVPIAKGEVGVVGDFTWT